jgi:hypothetical protein
MEVRSFDADLSEIMGPKCAKLLPRHISAWADNVVHMDIAAPTAKQPN